MAHYKFSRDDCVKGGKKGFEVTMERHPWMSGYLKYAPGMKRYSRRPTKFAPDGTLPSKDMKDNLYHG